MAGESFQVKLMLMRSNEGPKKVIWWIRRDLRLSNNPALKQAMAHGGQIIPLFIFDPHLLECVSERRKAFLYDGLKSLSVELEKRGSRLIIRTGDPIDVLRMIMIETGADLSCCEEDFTPYACGRDAIVQKEMPLMLTPGTVIRHPLSVLKPNGKPYKVYSAYKKNWISMPSVVAREDGMGVERISAVLGDIRSEPIPVHESTSTIVAGESAAKQQMKGFFQGAINEYKSNRDLMAINGTSRLSAYIRFGMLSVDSLFYGAQQLLNNCTDDTAVQSLQTWMNELIWREFYYSILFHLPNARNEALDPTLRNIRWRDDLSDLNAWKAGLTGYPIVDAGMRQLAEIGWMHNRARMITASFLVKDLLINWQLGEGWFLDQLFDADPASNNGGWQWCAGTGTDAVPYFRIFNPILQGKKYDPDGKYVRQWVPELEKVPIRWIHTPWLMPLDIQAETGVTIGKQYPFPIVDHSVVRERTMLAYQHSRRSNYNGVIL